jgi:hypothetical protein
MSPQPIRPLRFYELWMLRFLARSPRIDKIVVVQHNPDEELPAVANKDYVIQHLEKLYNMDFTDK